MQAVQVELVIWQEEQGEVQGEQASILVKKLVGQME